MQILVQETTGESRFRKWFSRDNLIILVLVGILLFVIALPTEDPNAESTERETENRILGEATHTSVTQGNIRNSTFTAENVSSYDVWAEYGAAQEEKLKKLLASMEGVGDVEVMLTFVSSEELVVEKDAPTIRSNTVEKDSAGGSRTITQFELGDTTVYSNVSGDSTPYVVKIINPRVEGVFVVAQGAGNSSVNRDITEAAQALFDVEAHKVKVVSMGTGMSGRTDISRTVTGLSGN